MEEIWKDIKGYEGLYQVSNLGNIRSLKFKNNIIEKERIRVLRQQLRNGYLTINLTKNGKRKNYQIHRLVAQEFISNPNQYSIVNHKDYKKTNNRVDNLEWCTQKYNVNYSICNMKNKVHVKNTETYGIYYREKHNNYEVNLKKKYYGKFSNYNEAKKKRDEILNELNIAI